MSNSATKKSDNIGVHLASLKKLPEIISSSIEVEIHPDYTKVNGTRNASNDINYETLVHRFYGAANIDDVVYRIKTTMRENISNSQQTTAHSYEVTKIELVEAPFANNVTDEPVAMTSTNSISAAKLLNGVEKSYEPGVKVLDVSEKTQDNAGDVMHSFEVTKIELLPEDNNSELEPTASNNQGQQTHRTTKLLNGV